MSTAPTTRSPRQFTRFLWPAALGVLLLAMAMDTKFLSPEETANTAASDPATSAAEQFPEIAAAVESNAVELAEVAEAVATDPAAAGEKYGHEAGTDKHAIPVRFTGTVAEAEAEFLTVEVPAMAEGSEVRVALGQAVNGTALRAAPGTISFSDFANQTDYQQFANELKTLVMKQLTEKVDAKSLDGSEVSVAGVYVTNTGPENSYLVTPVKVEAVN